MRAEPPLQRLTGVGRSRERPLPFPGEDGAGGWTPELNAPGGGDPVGEGQPVPATVCGERLAALRDTVGDRLPTGWRGGRPVPYRAAVAAVVVAVAMVLGLLAHRLSTAPTTVTLPESSTAPTGSDRITAVTAGARADTGAWSVGSVPATTPASGQGPAGSIVVDVEGKVRRPGLVHLSGGSRVADAIQAAGGVTPEAAPVRINLARPLSDGEQVVVPGPNDPIPPGANGTGGTGAGTTPSVGGGASAEAIDLNTATETQLDALPGIGPVLAGRIVQWRTEHGRFVDVDQLAEVKGIGEALLARLRPLVRV